MVVAGDVYAQPKRQRSDALQRTAQAYPRHLAKDANQYATHLGNRRIRKSPGVCRGAAKGGIQTYGAQHVAHPHNKRPYRMGFGKYG